MKNKVIICAAVVIAFVLATVVVVRQRSAEPEAVTEVQESQDLLAELPMENASAPELEQLIKGNQEVLYYSCLSLCVGWHRGSATYFIDGDNLSPIAGLSYDQDGQLTAIRDEASAPWEDNIYLLLVNNTDYDADYFTFALADGVPQKTTGVKTSVPGKSYVLQKLDLDFNQLPPQEDQYFDVLTVFQETAQQGLDIFEYYNSLNLRYQVNTAGYIGARLPELVINAGTPAPDQAWVSPHFEGDGIDDGVISLSGGTIQAKAMADVSGSFAIYVFADGSIISNGFWSGDKPEFAIPVDGSLMQGTETAGILVMSMFCPWNDSCVMDGSDVYRIEK